MFRQMTVIYVLLANLCSPLTWNIFILIVPTKAATYFVPTFSRNTADLLFAQSNINHDNCLAMRRPIWKDVLIQIGEDRVVEDKDDCEADDVINDITIWKREPFSVLPTLV